MPRPDSDWIACHMCNRGWRGNDPDKCSCGWRIATPSSSGCFLGAPIIGDPVEPPKPNGAKRQIRAKALYQRWLDYGDGFRSFLDYCYWDRDPERSWNGGHN
jgi:hypothetical protein